MKTECLYATEGLPSPFGEFSGGPPPPAGPAYPTPVPLNGDTGPSVPVATAKPRIILADASEARKKIQRVNSGKPHRGNGDVNWKRVRRAFHPARAFAVMNHPPETQPQERFCRYLRTVGWSFVAATDEVFWHTPSERPVDLWIDFWLTVDCDFGGSPNDIVVLTHRPLIVPTLRRLLDAGGRVAIVGLLGFFHPNLFELGDEYPDRCEVLDLEFDLQAVRLPRRFDLSDNHDYPEQLLLRVE